MARSVTFGGVTKWRPGGITKINADALNQIGVSAANTVGLIGEADGGAPGSVVGIITLRDPSRAIELFRSGPLVDAIRLAFQSSGDPRIPGGASEVVVYKVNASTQSSIHIPNPAVALLADVANAGSTTTLVNLDTATPAVNELADRWVDIAINSLPESASLAATGGSTTTFTAVGLSPGQYVGQIVQFDALTATVALQGVYATVIANDGVSLTFGEPLPAAVANLDALEVLATFRREIVSNTTTAITVTPALPVAPAAGDAIFVRPSLAVLTSKDYGAHTEGVSVDVAFNGSQYQAVIGFEGVDQVSPLLGGFNVLQVKYTGGANAVVTDVVTTPAGTTSTFLALLNGGLGAGAHDGATVVVTNPATSNSEQVRIDTNAPGSLTLEAPGLSDEFVEEIQAASADSVLVDIKTVTDAVLAVSGANGVATTLTSTITGVSGDNLNLTFTSSETLSSLANRINQISTYRAAVPRGINGDTSLAQTLDFGAGTSVNIQKEIRRNGSTGLKRDLHELLVWLNDTSDGASAVRANFATLDGSKLPRNEDLMVSLFEEPFVLAGGSRGTSSNSGWQEGFDTLLLRPMDNVVCLMDQDLVQEGFGSTATWNSVSAQLTDHVTRARGAAGVERGGFIGLRGTKTQLIAAANIINDADVQLVGQSPTVLDASGNLVQKGPRELAVMAASMRSGVPEVGEPLTHKFLRVSGLSQHQSWNPTDLTDSADLILGGVLFAEQIPGRGVRWVRDLTTWVQNDNLAYSEGSVRSVVRFVAYNLRTLLEDRYTGRKAAPATIASVKDTVATLLEAFRAESIIVDSTDPTTGATIRAWHALKVFSDGDVLRLNVGIFPVPGINFQLTEIFLSLPTQSA